MSHLLQTIYANLKIQKSEIIAIILEIIEEPPTGIVIYNIRFLPISQSYFITFRAHLFIRELAASGGSKMDVIAKNKEDYITFSIRVAVDKYVDKNGVEKSKEIELRFIDSFKFMSSSLDSLTTNLARGGQRLFGFEEYTSKQYELLVKKKSYSLKIKKIISPFQFE